MGQRIDFLGFPLDALTMEETVGRCIELVESRGAHQHVVLNAAKVVQAADDPELARIIRSCSLVSADGQSVVWGARALGLRVPERVTGIDLMERLLDVAERRAWPVYLLGARPEVNEQFAGIVASRHPRIVIAGRGDGYFRDDAAAAAAVRASGARVLFVAMPSPRKERFLAERLAELGPVLAMGVGGSFDVWTGRTSRAPRVLREAGLEWAYRLVQEPRRMWRRYLVGNARFVALIVKARMTNNLRPSAH